MEESLILAIAAIVLLGITAQWIAWATRIPSILLLLIIGLVAGPATGLLDPDALLGELLLPVVAMLVALILFEGGLNLNFAELRESGTVVIRLITVGAAATLVLISLVAWTILGLDPGLAVLVGAVLIVTGPTVIMPLLRHVRPIGQSGPILKWEGIVVDPIGAVIAVLVLEALIHATPSDALGIVAVGVLTTIVVGGAIGILGAAILVILIKRYWIPDFLDIPFAIMLVLATYAISNQIQAESGLLTVTVMGIALANQKIITVRHILHFGENLRVLIISSLFIILAARLTVDEISSVGVRELAFLAVLILVIRPIAILLSSVGSKLSRPDRIFLSWMAPRGIVAAAVASVFALTLTEAGYPGAEKIVPIVFLVIIGSVAIYGLSASPLSRRLGISETDPQGVLIVGAGVLGRSIAQVLHDKGVRVMVVDSNYANYRKAKELGLPATRLDILSDDSWDHLDLGGLGYLIATTPNDEVNALAALHYLELFGRKGVFHLPTKEIIGHEERPKHLRGRLLFGKEATYSELTKKIGKGYEVKGTSITEQFTQEEYLAKYGEDAVPMFIKGENGVLTIVATDTTISPKPGQTLVGLVNPAFSRPETTSAP